MMKIVPTKMQSRVANGTHPFEEEEEEEDQSILKCEVKFIKLGKGLKKNIDSKTIFPLICFLKLYYHKITYLLLDGIQTIHHEIRRKVLHLSLV
jgi:hypothetical protein